MLNKVFESLERIKTAPSFMGGTKEYQRYVNSADPFLKDIELVETYLKRLNAIDNTSSSEILKFVDDLLKRYEGKTDYNIYITKDWLLEIKQALIKAQENEKTLETIKNHLSFKDAGIETYNNQTKYLVEIESKDTGATIHIHLNEEEYDY